MLKEEYLQAAGGQRLTAATNFARDLMAGDQSRFKAGYSLANAVIAATEVFDLWNDEVNRLNAILDSEGVTQ